MVPLEFIELAGEADGKIIACDKDKDTIQIYSKNKFLNLSNDEILEAIETGKKGSASLKRNRFDSRYRLRIGDDTLKKWQPSVWFKTPYFLIVEKSCERNAKFQNYTLEEALNYISKLKEKNVITFKLITYSDYIGMGKKMSIVLKQDGRIIQPQNIIGSNELAEITSLWRFPTYRLPLTVNFCADEIDLHKRAELVYLYPTEEDAVSYTVNFSRYK